MTERRRSKKPPSCFGRCSMIQLSGSQRTQRALCLAEETMRRIRPLAKQSVGDCGERGLRPRERSRLERFRFGTPESQLANPSEDTSSMRVNEDRSLSETKEEARSSSFVIALQTSTAIASPVLAFPSSAPLRAAFLLVRLRFDFFLLEAASSSCSPHGSFRFPPPPPPLPPLAEPRPPPEIFSLDSAACEGVLATSSRRESSSEAGAGADPDGVGRGAGAGAGAGARRGAPALTRLLDDPVPPTFGPPTCGVEVTGPDVAFADSGCSRCCCLSAAGGWTGLARLRFRDGLAVRGSGGWYL